MARHAVYDAFARVFRKKAVVVYLEKLALDVEMSNSVELPRGDLVWSAYCYDVLVVVDANFEIRLLP